MKAAILPMSVMVGAGAITVIADRASADDGDSAAEVLRWIGDVALYATIAWWFVTLSVFLFMRPRFLVPPYLRHGPGYLKGLWRQWRSRR